MYHIIHKDLLAVTWCPKIIFIVHFHVPFSEAVNCPPLAAATECPRLRHSTRGMAVTLLIELFGQLGLTDTGTAVCKTAQWKQTVLTELQAAR
jgi:hypothetical protein